MPNLNFAKLLLLVEDMPMQGHGHATRPLFISHLIYNFLVSSIRIIMGNYAGL